MYTTDTPANLRAAHRAHLASSPLAAYTGLWKGTFRPAGAGSVPFTMRQEDVATGVHPVLAFPSRAIPPVGVRLVEASATAYEAVTEPFLDPTVGSFVTLHIRGTRRHNRLSGTFELLREDGSVAREGIFGAARYAAAAQVNYRW